MSDRLKIREEGRDTVYVDSVTVETVAAFTAGELKLKVYRRGSQILDWRKLNRIRRLR